MFKPIIYYYCRLFSVAYKKIIKPWLRYEWIFSLIENKKQMCIAEKNLRDFIYTVNFKYFLYNYLIWVIRLDVIRFFIIKKYNLSHLIKIDIILRRSVFLNAISIYWCVVIVLICPRKVCKFTNTYLIAKSECDLFQSRCIWIPMFLLFVKTFQVLFKIKNHEIVFLGLIFSTSWYAN